MNSETLIYFIKKKLKQNKTKIDNKNKIYTKIFKNKFRIISQNFQCLWKYKTLMCKILKFSCIQFCKNKIVI